MKRYCWMRKIVPSEKMLNKCEIRGILLKNKILSFYKRLLHLKKKINKNLKKTEK